MLAGRELSTAQLRERLARRVLPAADIDEAIDRLTREGAVDDDRMAEIHARRAAEVTLRGARRARREIEALGIDPDTARRAVSAVFDVGGEERVLERALAKRLDGRIRDRAQFRRLYHALLRQGFSPEQVMASLLARSDENPASVEE